MVSAPTRDGRRRWGRCFLLTPLFSQFSFSKYSSLFHAQDWASASRSSDAVTLLQREEKATSAARRAGVGGLSPGDLCLRSHLQAPPCPGASGCHSSSWPGVCKRRDSAFPPSQAGPGCTHVLSVPARLPPSPSATPKASCSPTPHPGCASLVSPPHFFPSHGPQFGCLLSALPRSQRSSVSSSAFPR